MVGLSTSDIWASTLVNAYHYDGASWALAPVDHGSGVPGGFAGLIEVPGFGLWAMAGTSLVRYDGVAWSFEYADLPVSDLLWASGPNDVYGRRQSLDPLWHWDGIEWSWVEGVGDAFVLVGRSDHDVWTGGMVHWDGTSWMQFAVPVWNPDLTSAAWVSPSGTLWLAGGTGDVIRHRP
jgi:hypothetical protein